MSNLSDLLKQILGTNGEAAVLVGNVIGTLADAAGAVGGVTIILDSLLGSDAQMQTSLDAIQSAILHGFAALQEEQHAENILSRQGTLDPAAAQAQTAVDQLKDDLRRQPPVSQTYALGQIGLCLDAVNQLDHDDRWLTVYGDEIYYGDNGTDYWSGRIAPVPNPDGTVFSDRYVLPYFLKLLFDFMLVAAAFEPDYAEQYQQPLTRFAARLQTVYETSMNGIVTIPKPPIWMVGITRDPDPGGPLRYCRETEGVTFLVPCEVTPDHKWGWFSLEGAHPYGVVHTYSGYGEVKSFPMILLPAIPPEEFWPQFTARLDLVIRRNWKTAYRTIGLASAWQVINILRGLTHQPPLAAYDSGTSWTVREVDQILGSSFPDPMAPSPASVSARDQITWLYAAAETKAPSPLSWRDALTAALDHCTHEMSAPYEP